MAQIKPRNGRMIVHEEGQSKERRHLTAQTNPQREALKFIDEKDAVTNSKSVLVDVPIDLINDRPINKFRMTGIEELAKEIERDGLFHNIIITPKEGYGGGYVVSSGHRRIHAYRYLKEKFDREHPGEENPYNKIKAEIKKNLSKEEEEGIYLRTNSFSRNTTLMEAIANLNPEEMDFNDSVFKEKYLTYMYGDNALERYVTGEISDTFSSRSLADYVYKKIIDTYQDIECTPEAVRRYLRIYDRCSDVVKEKFFKNELSIKQLMDITTNFSKDEQNLIYNSENPDAKRKEIMQRHRASKKKKEKVADNEIKQLKKEITKYAKPIAILCDQLDKMPDIDSEENKEYINEIETLRSAIHNFLHK